MIIYDGQTYEDSSQVPDLGTIECVKVEGKIRHYVGMSDDESKLDVITYVATGSTCIMADTGDMYTFADSEWHKTFSNG